VSAVARIMFRWRYRATRQVFAKVQTTHEVTARLIANALVHTYSRDCEAHELPKLTRSEVEFELRRKLAYVGTSWEECAVWDEVGHDELDAFTAWAGETVRRCFPELADDAELARLFPVAEPFFEAVGAHA
jgi:hypothetical protein